MKEKAIFNWSGGKDSAMALNKVLVENRYEIVGLLTSINDTNNRISMHGVRYELLQEQANRLQLPLFELRLSDQTTMQQYESEMNQLISQMKISGVTVALFGDIFLEDLRRYREEQLKPFDIRAEFPLWNTSTTELSTTLIDLGFKAVTTCVNENFLDESFAGKMLNRTFFESLPKHIDPCGEYGEFHTFVFDAPMFSSPIPIEIGETIYYQYPTSETDDDAHKAIDTSKHQTPGVWFTDLKLSNRE